MAVHPSVPLTVRLDSLPGTRVGGRPPRGRPAAALQAPCVSGLLSARAAPSRAGRKGRGARGGPGFSPARPSPCLASVSPDSWGICSGKGTSVPAELRRLQGAKPSYRNGDINITFGPEGHTSDNLVDPDHDRTARGQALRAPRACRALPHASRRPSPSSAQGLRPACGCRQKTPARKGSEQGKPGAPLTPSVERWLLFRAPCLRRVFEILP